MSREEIDAIRSRLPRKTSSRPKTVASAQNAPYGDANDQQAANRNTIDSNTCAQRHLARTEAMTSSSSQPPRNTTPISTPTATTEESLKRKTSRAMTSQATPVMRNIHHGPASWASIVSALAPMPPRAADGKRVLMSVSLRTPASTVSRDPVNDHGSSARAISVEPLRLTQPRARAASGALVVGNDLGYRTPAVGRQDRVGDPVKVRGAEPEGQTPATPACPGGVVGLNLGAEQVAGLRREPGPGRQHVDRGVADAQPAEVDDGCQPAVAGQQIQGREVGVYPARRTRPRRSGHGRLPCGSCQLGIHDAVLWQVADLGADLAIEGADRLGPERRRRPARSVDPLEGCDEPAQPRGRVGQVDIGLIRNVLAIEPPVHRPRKGKPFTGSALRERHRYGERQQRSQPGQPLLFPGQGRNGSWTTGQAHGHFLTESVDRVIGASGGHLGYRQARPVRELFRDQPTDDRSANIDFVRIHLLVPHGHFLLASSASSA